MNEVPTGLQVAASSRSWDWLQIKCVARDIGEGQEVSGVGCRGKVYLCQPKGISRG